jgi:1-acyl-sn-glycerol-3-phosphate acyltransferase
MPAQVAPAQGETAMDPLGPRPTFAYHVMYHTLGRLVSTAWRIKFVHAERVPAEGPVVLVANHRSFVDPFAVGLGLSWRRPVHFMAKAEMFKQPLKTLLVVLNSFPVNRGGADRAAIRQALTLLGENRILGMFPEGTRVHEGEVAQAQAGAAFLSLKTGSKIVPVGLVGTEKIVRPGKKLPALPPVTVMYGHQIDPADFEGLPSKERLPALTRALMEGIDESMREAIEYARSR